MQNFGHYIYTTSI